MTPSANTRGFGNPDTKSFKTKYIRTVKYGDSTLYVHAALVDVVTAILRDACDVPEGLVSWADADTGASMPRALGIAFGYHESLDGHYERWGFIREGDLLVFTGTAKEAEALSERAEQSRLQPVIPGAESTGVWYAGGFGSREFGEGDMGDDVQCLQLALSCPTQSGHFDKTTEAYVQALNEKNGIQGKPGMFNESTARLLTRLPGMISRGDTGARVRVLQAALIAYDWQYDLRVTGNVDRQTEAAVKKVQEELGLRQSGIVRQTEWLTILGIAS